MLWSAELNHLNTENRQGQSEEILSAALEQAVCKMGDQGPRFRDSFWLQANRNKF